MRGIKGSLIIIIVLIFAGSLYIGQDKFLDEPSFAQIENEFVPKALNIDNKRLPLNSIAIKSLEGDLFDWIGRDISYLVDSFGEPDRKDLSSYNYTWWVFTDHNTNFIGFGVEDGTIVTIYATGNDLSSEPIEIGQSYNTVNELLAFEEDISFTIGHQTYRFHLSAEDLKRKPMTKIADDIYMQSYFDTFTGQLSSIRLLTSDVLLLQRPYEIYYRGDLPELPLLTEDQWDIIQTGMEQQIFDITNVIRKRFNKEKLEWDQHVSDVAFQHSKDMEENNYFSHYTQNGEGLKERLISEDIFYLAAGENIAAQYTDGPAAVEGWLNSESHRESLLKNEYTHLGVGVYRYYYTQNFLHLP